MNELQHPLITLYGSDALEQAQLEILTLKNESNIPFDKEYISLGIGFLNIKSKAIVDDNTLKPSLKALITSSFGEAAIYKYNCCGGEL